MKILAFLGKCQEKDALKVYGGHTFRWLEVKFYIFWLRGDRRRKYAYLIFVTGTTGGARGEKICHVEKFLHMTWRDFPHDRLSCEKFLHVIDCHVEKALHMRNVKKICKLEK